MSLHTPPLQRNAPFHAVNQPKGNPFLSLRTIPLLIVLAGSLAIQPAVLASPVVKTIPVSGSGGVFGIVASPNRSQVYVADFINSRIAAIDTVTNQILFFIPTTHPPTGLGISPDGNTLYVTEIFDFLEAISVPTLTSLFVVTVGGAPEIPGVASNGSTVYTPNSVVGTVTPVGGPLSGASITVGGLPNQVVFKDDNTSAYVINFTNRISVINTATGSVTKFKTATDTFGLAIEGTTLFATGTNRVFVINTNTNTVIHTINVPHPSGHVLTLAFPALTPDGAFLYVPVFATGPTFAPGNTVVVINTKTNKVVQTFTVGTAPFQVATASNDIYGYVTNDFDGTVTVFQLAHLPPGL